MIAASPRRSRKAMGAVGAAICGAALLLPLSVAALASCCPIELQAGEYVVFAGAINRAHQAFGQGPRYTVIPPGACGNLSGPRGGEFLLGGDGIRACSFRGGNYTIYLAWFRGQRQLPPGS
jgi:hypothetical protein